jgi:hypothetical protein
MCGHLGNSGDIRWLAIRWHWHIIKVYFIIYITVEQDSVILVNGWE